MPDPEQKEALRQLLRVAQAMEPGKIIMTHWAEREDCGTTACLMGHAAMDPWFMDEGWSLRWAKPNLKGMLCFEDTHAAPEDRVLFFGLDDIPRDDEDDSWDDFLFMPTSYRHTYGPRLKGEIIEHVKYVCEVADAIPVGTEV